jgi:hypothetical protein
VDVPVLKYLDVLIGLALTMVLLSTVVLAVTQLILNASLARPRHLRRGVERLVVQLEPATMRPHAVYFSRLLIRHPLVGQQTAFSPFRYTLQWLKVKLAQWTGIPSTVDTLYVLPATSPGSVIQREELAYLLIEAAAGEGPLMDPLNLGFTPKRILDAQAALASALRAGGVEDPAATLRAIRLKTVENERAQPGQAARLWRTNAITDSAPSDFVGKLHASFDNTIARVTDAFAGESKLWASGIALLLVISLQVDTFALVKRLSLNDADRMAFVEAANKLVTDRKALQSDASADAATVAANKEALATNQAAQDELNESITLLNSPSLKLLPKEGVVNPFTAIRAAAGFGTPSEEAKRWPGVLFTWVLVSLGAPFWFDLLKNMLKLRSLLAKQDDDERKKRQDETEKEPASKKGTTAADDLVPIHSAEIGDLSATGANG